MPEERLCRKYIIRKTDGSSMEYGSKYFVLRYDENAQHGKTNREALRHWCKLSKDTYPELTSDLLKDMDSEVE